MTRTLWRLDGAHATTLAEPIRLAQGLRLHLEHTELTTVLMQLGDQQQAYIGATGCEGCAHGRCTPGCYVELLRRLLRACFDASTLCAVAGGLARRPYRRVALAWPTAQIAVMGAQGAANILHRKELKKIEEAGGDVEARRAELISEYEDTLANPYIAAERGYVDAVISPHETRLEVVRALRLLETKRETLPPKKHGNIPL